MATALASALSGRPVRHDVGMTGEITLRGKVLPVGGVREKVVAAYRLKLRSVLLPEKNKKDLVDIPSKARHALEIRFVNHMDDVLGLALRPESKRAARRGSSSSGSAAPSRKRRTRRK
jgi:ATP-dependent Lon protease